MSNPVTSHIYRIKFYNQGDIYELYALEVSQSDMLAFIEIGQILFNERSQVLVDPSEEKLKLEFEGVERTYIPLQSVIRIDKVDKQGCGKITSAESGKNTNITPFPLPPGSPDKT